MIWIRTLAFSVFVVLAYGSPGAVAQTKPVVIDGLAQEWIGSPPAYSDPTSDGGGGVNFARLWIGSSAAHLMAAIEIGAEIGLQADNAISLYLDTDLNAQTGQSFSGIGADLVWNFGQRSGRFRSGNAMVSVDPEDVGLVTAPTLTSEFFEMAFALDATPDGTSVLFPSDSIRVAFSDGSNGDRLPDQGVVLTVPIGRDTPVAVGPADLSRNDPSDFRLLTYNVENGGLFSAGFTSAHRRILTGLAPDIMTFQEIPNRSPQETADRVESLYPAGVGSQWYASGSGTDIVLVSRYPIIETYELQRANPSGFGNRAFRVDLGDLSAKDLLIVAAHLPCCDEDGRRQREADEIMAFIRDGILDDTIEPQLPIIITGDLNLVGDASQLITLLSGQIVNATYGPSFPPDWDGSDFTDLVPGTTGTPFAYTWKGQGYSPGRLDYFIYSDAVLGVGKSFALETTALTLEELTAAGLRRSDSSVSDHLPIVADFRFVTDTAVETKTPGRGSTRLIEAVYPNPANDRITVRLNSSTPGPVVLETIDMLGRTVSRFETAPRPGKFHVRLRPDLADGVYLLTAQGSAGKDATLFVVRRR